MKTDFLRLLGTAILSACFSLCIHAIENEPAKVTFRFDAGKEGQTALLEPTDCFQSSYVSVGSSLSWFGTKTVNGQAQTAFQPLNANEKSANDGNLIRFALKTKTGIRFTPTKIHFQSTRFGTDGGLLDVRWLNSDGSTVSLQQGINPNRDNGSPNYTDFNTGIETKASEGECALLINLYSLGNTKQVGFRDIVIEGKIDGEIADIPVYSLKVGTYPENAGELSVAPYGTQFDAGTDITVKQERRFGYRFVHWADAEGKVISTEEEYTFTISADTELTACYESIPIHSLDLDIEGGATDYMVEWSPAPVMKDGKCWFEENTEVCLTATSNAILYFIGWDTGETSSEIRVLMDRDRSLTARYVAADFVAGWDFWLKGNSGRKADFFSEGNDAAALVMRKEDGSSSSWLDKSQEAAGGYEGKPAAVCWKGITENYYYQINVNASNFSHLHISAALLYNFLAYTTQICQYSLDDKNWTTLGKIVLEGAKQWVYGDFDLPEDADHAKELHIRWISDDGSELKGSGDDKNGLALAEVFLMGQLDYADDGKAPALVSQTPAENSRSASVNGKAVLQFDERIQVSEGCTATLNGRSWPVQVNGQTLTVEYTGLDYQTDYTFVLPAGSVSDRSGNRLDEAIEIHFTTRQRPEISKALFDFTVPDDGSFEQAVAAAQARKDKNLRFRIFVRQGQYVLEGDKGATVQGSDGKTYRKPTTTVQTPNLSIIGEDRDATVLLNQHEAFPLIEGLSKCQTIDFQSACKNVYVQDISFKNGMRLNEGRGPALQDQGDKNIFKNVALLGYQDTYLSNNASGRYYFEGGELHGSVDYLCGKGDVLYNEVELVIERDGSVLCAPSQARQYGYVFLDCRVSSVNRAYSYQLGRPWGSGTPGAIFINLTMEQLASAEGWAEMSGGWPMRFAEYGTRTSSGTVVDLRTRKTTFGDGHTNNPVLTAEEAAQYSIDKVLGGNDHWDPTYYTEQLAAPELRLEGSTLRWNDSPYALCYAICKDGKVLTFTTDPFFELSEDGVYTLRVANEMGGLGATSNTCNFSTDALHTQHSEKDVIDIQYFNAQGLRMNAPANGLNIELRLYRDGSRESRKWMKEE